ncbi:MAG: efflux RND transporter periplasmic adaptor subunit, partial [Bacteroidota bacterium]|nr:efflux RND transporter periplasmic adaptor subunit [Bacteroidota bacterium]
MTGFIFILLTACGSSDKKTTTTQSSGPGGQTAANPQPPMPVDVYIVTPTLINQKIEVPGSLMANESTEIHPEISGRLVQLNIAEGRFVSRG